MVSTTDTPRVIEVNDDSVGLKGWVVIDRTIGGESSGGLRMTSTVNAEELSSLARTMSLKYGFCFMPKGGAKSGIQFDPESDEGKIRAILASFGKGIRPLMDSRAYVPGPDLGTGDDRIRHLIAASGSTLSRELQWSTADSGFFTAVGVVSAFETICDTLGISPGNRCATIEGLGSVGSCVFRLLRERGVKVIGIANRYGAVQHRTGIDYEVWRHHERARGPSSLRELAGVEPIEREAFLKLPSTAFLPCAHSFSINGEDARKLRAPLLIPGANNPFAGGGEEALLESGKTVLPDFVVNSGGVIGGALTHGLLERSAVATHVEEIVGAAVQALYQHSGGDSRVLLGMAVRTAEARFEEVARSPSSRIIRMGLQLRRKGIIRGGLSRTISRSYAAHLRAGITRIIT